MSHILHRVSQGDYVVKVCAVGNGNESGVFETGEHYLNSSYSQTQTTTKLAMQELLFNKQNSTISIKDFDPNASLNLKLIVYFYLLIIFIINQI